MRKSNAIVFSLASCKQDVDPRIHLFVNRVLCMRRIMAKHSGAHQQVVEILKAYDKLGKGSQAVEATPGVHHAFGPIGQLIKDIHRMGGQMGPDLVARWPNEAAIDLWNMPWQHLKKAVAEVAVLKRNAEEMALRAHASETKEADQELIKTCINKLHDKEQKVLSHIASGAA